MAVPKFPFSTNSTYFFMDDHTLSIPLLTTTTTALTTASTTSGRTTEEDHESGIFSMSSANIISRLLLVVFIGTISVWANHEASKGFKVTIINNAATVDSPAGRRFNLFYVSNDEATRIILNTSALVENILYPQHHHSDSDHLTKKPVHHVVLQLSAGDNLPKTTTTEVSVSTSKSKESVYIISLSPSIMEESDFKYRVISAIQRAMARIWLWDGQSIAPPWLIDGMEEYLWMQAGFGETTPLLSVSESLPEQLSSVLSQVCSESSKMNISGICGDQHYRNRAKHSDGNYKEEPKIVAQALDYLERENRGFIQGLNQILRDDGWD